MKHLVQHFIKVFLIVLIFSRCGTSSPDVTLPAYLQSVWVEDSVKNGFPGEEMKYEKSSGYNIIKLVQQGKKAVMLRFNSLDPFSKDSSWSGPFSVKEAGANNWTVSYKGRKIGLQFNSDRKLFIHGLDMRSYNPQLIKRDPEPVDAIFVKKN